MRESILLAAMALLVVAVAAPAPPTAAAPQAEAASESDSELCAACHEEHVEQFGRTPHRLIDEPGWGGDGVGSCASCHGDAEQHLEEGGGEGTIFAFRAESGSMAGVAVCQQCHGTEHPGFLATRHAATGVGCTDCHQIHGELGAASLLGSATTVTSGWSGDELGPGSAICRDCHDDVFAQFGWNERHRLQEGILDCVSCHDPHAPQDRLALGGFKQQACIDCHGDKGGPFVFEHGSSRVEGCTSCHSPHGSPNRHLLAFQNQGELCYSCHPSVPGFHIASAAAPRFGLDANCTNCHSAIHGSNFDPFFLK